MSTAKTDISADSTTSTRPAFSNLIKHKIGKFHNARKRFSSRSKSSPALMDSKIHPSKPALKRQKSITDEIPSCQTIIDLTVLKGDDLVHATRSLISTLFSPIKDGEDVKLDRVSGAMTNAVFFVTIGSTKRMLLRVYGVGCDQILDRDKELDWLSRLSQLSIGPKLLGIFGNGRFEEYLPSTTLTRQDIREPQISTQIASRLHQLHSIVETFPPAHNETLEVWANIDKWYTTITTELVPALSKNETWKTQLEEIDLVQLGHDIQQCKLACNNSPIVFAHNDLQYGNILKINGTDELVVIDFEYAGYNPRAVDIANHFCEWMYDYHSSNSATMHLDQYPSLQEQNKFLASYLHTEDQSLVMELQKEVDQWKMSCHLFWGLWGLVQASQSEIDFDYFYYSVQRINEFRANLNKSAPVYCYHCKLCDTSLTDLKAVFEHQKLARSVRSKIIHVKLEPDIDDPNYCGQAYEVTLKEKAYYRNQLQKAHRMILKRLHPARSRYAIVPDSNNPTLLCRRI